MLAEYQENSVQIDRRATRDQVVAFQKMMAQMPQAPGMTTEHFFAGGMYCRRIEIPKDTIIVSKLHKTEHFFIGCVGQLRVAGQGETYIIGPGDIVPSPIGTKRVVHALTDVVVLTVHKTNRIVADSDLEDELIEEDPLSLYDMNNQPKQGVTVSLPYKEGA